MKEKDYGVMSDNNGRRRIQAVVKGVRDRKYNINEGPEVETNWLLGNEIQLLKWKHTNHRRKWYEDAEIRTTSPERPRGLLSLLALCPLAYCKAFFQFQCLFMRKYNAPSLLTKKLASGKYLKEENKFMAAQVKVYYSVVTYNSQVVMLQSDDETE